MSQLFISYSRKDGDFAIQLANSLSKLGVAIWIDINDIPAGLKWSTGVHQGLKTCEIMIVIISPDSMASSNVEDEWQYFLDENKPLIPIFWKPAESHYQLRRIQHIDFHGQVYELAFSQLCGELQRKGVQFNEEFSTNTDNLNCEKVGNLFWLVHDFLELHRWLLAGIEKQWLDIGLRQSYHHASQFGIDQNILDKLAQLRNNAQLLREEDWTTHNREFFAGEVRILFNAMAQEVQRADPNFNSGPG